MTIKPLEKKTNPFLLLKVLFLATLVATGVFLDRVFIRKNEDIPSVLGKTKEVKEQTNNFVEDSVKQAQNLGESVLGETTSLIQDTTQNISTSVSDLIYENSFGKIVDQIDKLPTDQQERIRQEICK